MRRFLQQLRELRPLQQVHSSSCFPPPRPWEIECFPGPTPHSMPWMTSSARSPTFPSCLAPRGRRANHYLLQVSPTGPPTCLSPPFVATLVWLATP